MAVITTKTESTPLKHPREEGVEFWVKPITNAVLLKAKDLGDGSTSESMNYILVEALEKWSYEDELNAENIGNLDAYTSNFLFVSIVRDNAYDPDEVKNSGASSDGSTTVGPEDAGQKN